jgi:hypothetical protein
MLDCNALYMNCTCAKAMAQDVPHENLLPSTRFTADRNLLVAQITSNRIVGTVGLIIY